MYEELAKTLGMPISEVKDLVDKKKRAESKKKLILEVEINIDDKAAETCLIYEGDTPESVIQKIAEKHKLSKEERKAIMDQLKQCF